MITNQTLSRFLTKMSFDSDREYKKVRNPWVTFEVKEDQEFDMQVAKKHKSN